MTVATITKTIEAMPGIYRDRGFAFKARYCKEYHAYFIYVKDEAKFVVNPRFKSSGEWEWQWFIPADHVDDRKQYIRTAGLNEKDFY